MTTDEWARMTLRVWPAGVDLCVIEQTLGLTTECPDVYGLIISVWEADGVPLQPGWDRLEQLLIEHHEALLLLTPGVEIDVLVAWTPRDPQDHLYLSPRLFRLLGELNVAVRLDTWVDYGS